MFHPPRSGFDRIPYLQSCEVARGADRSRGLICNLSMMGIYLHHDELPEVGAEVALRFRLPDDGPEVEAGAAVIWVNESGQGGPFELPRGYGARFVAASPEAIRRIAAFVGNAQAAANVGGRASIHQPDSGSVRIPWIAPCRFVHGRVEIPGSICNLSQLGVFAALERIPAAGTVGELSFDLPGLPERFAAAATVIWVNPEHPKRVRALPPGCGLRFHALRAEEDQAIADLVADFIGFAPRPTARSLARRFGQ